MISSWLPNLKKKVPFCFHSYVKVPIQTWSSVLPSLVILNSNFFLSLIRPVESPSHLCLHPLHFYCNQLMLLGDKCPQMSNSPLGFFLGHDVCPITLLCLIPLHRMLFDNSTSFVSFSLWRTGTNDKLFHSRGWNHIHLTFWHNITSRFWHKLMEIIVNKITIITWYLTLVYSDRLLLWEDNFNYTNKT